MSSSRTLRAMRLALLALFLFSVGLIVWNWNASPWWELPVGLAAGYALSIVLWCVIPPRFPLPWPWPKLIAAAKAHRQHRAAVPGVKNSDDSSEEQDQ